MPFLPMPENRMLSLSEVRFMARYVNEYHTPKDPVLDPSHIHGYYEIYLNLTGDISFLVNNHIYAVQHGDIILTRPGDVHVCILNSPCVHEHVCLWLDMPRGHALAEGFEENGAALWRPQGEERERLIASFLQLAAPQEKEQTLSCTAHLLYILAALAARKRQEEQRTAYAELPAELQRVLDLINTHFCELHSPADLLEKIYISPATLSRWFRRYIHLSPRTFLEAKKISYAKELLQRGCSVSEASEKTGFSDCSYFISVFRRRCGMTPLQFKRANGNE